MKRQILSFALALVMCISIVPASVFASEPADANTGITESKTETTTENADKNPDGADSENENSDNDLNDADVGNENAGVPVLLTDTEPDLYSSDAEGQIAIDKANFPDAKFREYVTQFDTDENGVFSQSELDAVNLIRLTKGKITSLKGIEYFKNVKNLTVYINNIETVDLSKNINLEIIDLGDNPNLTKLDISNNKNLTELYISNTGITTIDISNQPNLNKVVTNFSTKDNTLIIPSSGINLSCFGNYLNNGSDIIGSSEITEITGGKLEKGKLTFNENSDTITFKYEGHTTTLKKVGAAPQPPVGAGIAIDQVNFPDAKFREYVTQFDTDKNGAFSQSELDNVTAIMCSRSGIESLKGIEHFKNVSEITAYSNLITSVDLSKNTNLEIVDLSRNPNLTELDIRNNKKVNSIYISNTGITTLDISNQNEILSIITNFSAKDNTLIIPSSGIALFCFGNYLNNGSDLIESSEITDITGGKLEKGKFTFNENSDTITFKYGGHTTTLKKVGAAPQPPVGAEIAIDQVNFPDAKFREYVTQFDADKNGAFSQSELDNVTSIICPSREIKSLKGIEHFKNINEVIAHINNISTVDLSENTNLEVIDLGDNPKLTELDISNNKNLTEIYIPNTGITTIDISNQDALVTFVTNFSTKDITLIIPASGFSLSCLENFVDSMGEVIEANYITDITGGRLEKGEFKFSENSDTITFKYEGHTTTLKKSTAAPQPPAADGIAIDQVNFPDFKFREYVRQFDIDENGAFSQSELDNVTSIICPSREIKSLKGIEHFKNINEVIAYINNISTVDLSENTNLEVIDLGDNPKLTELDISNNKNLTRIYIPNTGITTIDISNQDALVTFVTNFSTKDITLIIPASGFSLSCLENFVDSMGEVIEANYITDITGGRLEKGEFKFNENSDTITFKYEGHTITLKKAGTAPQPPVTTKANVTFKVVNGKWADGSTADKIVEVTLTGGKGTLSQNKVPTGMTANAGYENGKWDVTPNTTNNGITGNVTYTYKFTAKAPVTTTANVTFKVVNGKWADGSTADKIVEVTLTGGQGTLSQNKVPTGMTANAGYENGKWDVTPNITNNGITGNVIYTYTFTAKAPVTTTANVTFKVSGGTWADGKTDPITVEAILTNGKGKLTNEQIPTGMKPDQNHKAGGWGLENSMGGVYNKTPYEVEITGDCVFIYAFFVKDVLEATPDSLVGGGEVILKTNNQYLKCDDKSISFEYIGGGDGFNYLKVVLPNVTKNYVFTASDDGDFAEGNLTVTVRVTKAETPDPERPDPDRPRPRPDHNHDDDDKNESIRKPVVIKPSVVITPSMNPPTGASL